MLEPGGDGAHRRQSRAGLPVDEDGRVVLLVEAEVGRGHDRLDDGLARRVGTRVRSPTVVGDADRPVVVQLDPDVATGALEGLVDRVGEHLEHEVGRVDRRPAGAVAHGHHVGLVEHRRPVVRRP
ncbi:hypothetical protein [Aeromicrobium halocynthiae]|uniref:hypothetical protein n=1 Tax=Aeromicrobium halocynthiae TaxID=560557 RepID=UPI0031E37FFF